MELSALRKAAVFLGSLPDSQAAGLLAVLSPDQSAAVMAEMAAMGTINDQEQEVVVGELVHSEAVEQAAVERSPFDFLAGLSVDDLLVVLGDEHPQTIALVLGQLPVERAAALIPELSPKQQASVIARIARSERPSREVAAEVAHSLRRRLVAPVRVSIARGMRRLVKMFGSMRPATERKLLGTVAQADPELLHAIRVAMFGPDVATCGDWNLTAAS